MSPATTTDRWTCPRCQRPTTVTGSPTDTAAALAAVRCRHSEGHAAGDHVLDDVGLAGASVRAKARRAAKRAAAGQRLRRRQQPA